MFEPFSASAHGYQLSSRSNLHYIGNSACMVWLGMIHNDMVDGFWTCENTDLIFEIFFEAGFTYLLKQFLYRP